MTETTDPQACPGCQHPQHAPNTECPHRVEHDGQRHWHLCLCLNRQYADRPCSPLMTCQGGALGYGDIWYLQRGHSLSSANGVITPEVLTTAAPAAVPSAPTDRAALSARLRQMTDHWEQQLPEVIRTPAVVSAIRAALEAADDPSRMADEAQQPETRQSCACGQDGCEYCDVDDEPQDDGDVFELPGPEVVAYRNSQRPSVLLCRDHGDGWMGLTPLTSDDLPDGGTCTYGDPADPDDVCGRDVLIVEARQADTAGEQQ